MGTGQRIASRLLERLRRSINEFLAIPVVIVLAFFAFALVVNVIDGDAGSRSHWSAMRLYLAGYVGDGSAATGLLTTIAGSLITVTSITFSILMLAVQQGASALTSQIIDHYLRRLSNRIYFGLFVGTSVFALVTLVLTTSRSAPVLGATFATLFAGGALFALILLIYSTINQIRPVTVINNIHDVVLETRLAQRDLLARTAPGGGLPGEGTIVVSGCAGYLARVRLAELEGMVRKRPDIRIAIVPSVGDYLACGQPLARVVSVAVDDALVEAVRHALPIEEQRDVGHDAAFGVDHIANIAWTTTSTAKSNPAVSLLACHSLHDILVRWAADEPAERRAAAAIAYADRTFGQLLDAMESLIVVASESMQHQTLAALVDALADALNWLDPAGRDRVEAILMTSLPALGDHVPTRLLEASYARAIASLREAHREDAAAALERGWSTLAQTRGTIKSRGNRA